MTKSQINFEKYFVSIMALGGLPLWADFYWLTRIRSTWLLVLALMLAIVVGGLAIFAKNREHHLVEWCALALAVPLLGPISSLVGFAVESKTDINPIALRHRIVAVLMVLIIVGLMAAITAIFGVVMEG